MCCVDKSCQIGDDSLSTRITYIHQHFRRPTEAGGTRSWEFARRLAADGLDVTIICAGSTRRRFRESGFDIIQLPVSYSNDMSFMRRVLSFLHFMVIATATACRTSADIVLATSTPLTVAIPGMTGALVQRAKFVLEVRDLWPEVPIALGLLKNPLLKYASRALERVSYRRAERVIALSPSMAEGVRRVSPSTDVTLAPNACDFDLFDVPSSDREAFRAAKGWTGRIAFVYVGSFGESYAVDDLVALAADFKCDRRVNFTIVGEGALSQRCASLAQGFGLDVVELLPGTVSKQEAALYVASADVILSSLDDVPALQGNSLNKVFDAMAASRPVLFTHRGWLAELLQEKGAGWILPSDARGRISCIEQLAASPERVMGAGLLAGELGRSQFHRDGVYQTFKHALLKGS